MVLNELDELLKRTKQNIHSEFHILIQISIKSFKPSSSQRKTIDNDPNSKANIITTFMRVMGQLKLYWYSLSTSFSGLRSSDIDTSSVKENNRSNLAKNILSTVVLYQYDKIRIYWNL